MQAVILAAGMGKRLGELTQDSTKCMIRVNGMTLIERMLTQLDRLSLTRVIMVVGYKAEHLKEHIAGLDVKTPITYVENDIYFKTNNIYSLYLAHHFLVEDDTILLESDLIFEDSVLKKLTDSTYPSLALIAKYESWMDGTVVTLGENGSIISFLDKKHFQFNDIKNYYKTVNIYKFSKEFSKNQYIPFLEAYVKALGCNEYYEQVLKIVLMLDDPGIRAEILDEDQSWYEIDDIQDLDIAESIFTDNLYDKYQKMSRRFGGYWRYPHLTDFCYLVNPFYPTQKLLDEMKASFERIVCEYPSGLSVNNLLAAKYFGIHEKQIVVGNGAAEIIKEVMRFFRGKIGVISPTFEEYPNRSATDEVVYFQTEGKGYSYSSKDVEAYFEDKEISVLILINPDNPSGNFMCKSDVLHIAQWSKERQIRLIVDESFMDFAHNARKETILHQSILNEYPNLAIIKSISKSFGVPGLRLGILASTDEGLMSHLNGALAIWNINSTAEFFLQIFEKYTSDYWRGMDRFSEIRECFFRALAEIDGIRPMPSQANYIMCEVTSGITSLELAMELLDKYNILIKSLSGKKGIGGQYIRVAVKRPEENEKLAYAMKAILTKKQPCS